MKDVTLVFTPPEHPLAARLNRLKRTGIKFLHRNASEWEGNVSPCKAIAIEDRSWPEFEFRVINEDTKQIEKIKRTLADVYEEAGIPIRMLKPRRRIDEAVVIDIEGDAEIKARENEYLKTTTPPTIEGRKQKRSNQAKSAKRKL